MELPSRPLLPFQYIHLNQKNLKFYMSDFSIIIIIITSNRILVSGGGITEG